jgi:PIN domain nuclease of toxin-antitoxin system
MSAIVLWEIANSPSWAASSSIWTTPNWDRTLTRIQTWPLTLDICCSIKSLYFDSDPADEIIAATSLVHRGASHDSRP